MFCNDPRRDLVADCVLAGRSDLGKVVGTEIQMTLVNQDIKAQYFMGMLLLLDTYALPHGNRPSEKARWTSPALSTLFKPRKVLNL
jgi:hypothetical protein